MTEKSTENIFRSRCEFCVSLRFELFDAIHILLSPNARIHKQWRDNALLALPREFHENVRLLGSSSELWPAISSLLPRDRPVLTYEEIVSMLESLRNDDFQLRILKAMIHDESLAKKLIQEKCTLKSALKLAPPKKREWFEFIGLFPFREDAALVRAFEELLAQPTLFKRRIIVVLNCFWKTLFQETWISLEKQYHRSVREKEKTFHVCSLEEFSQQALLRVLVDESHGELRAIRGGYRLPFKRVGKCFFMPSAFNDRRYWSALEQGKTDSDVHVYFPYFDPSISLDFAPGAKPNDVKEPEMDVALIMKALGDASRFAIALLIAKTALTSVEISRALGLTKPTVSHHISILREAGLIEDTYLNGRTRMRLRRKTIEALTPLSLDRFFHQQETSG